MHVPALFHAVDLQTHVNAGSLCIASKPIHAMQTVELVHSVHLLLQPKLSKEIFINLLILKTY